MKRFSKSALLLGAALAVLSACSNTKGPGEIGTKEDIVVRNNGLPGAAKAPAPDADFSSTVEQAEAVPAPAVAAAEPLPDVSPAVETAAQQVADAKAPMPATTTTPANDLTMSNTAPATDAKPIDQIAPQIPVQAMANIAPPAQTTQPVAPAPAPTSAPENVPVPAPASVAAAPAPAPAPAVSPSSVYPAADYPVAPGAAPTTTPAPAPVPSLNAYVPAPAGAAYPLDPNAPYSPKAMAGATATASAPGAATPTGAIPAAGLDLSDPAVIRSAQTALKTKAGYPGEATGTIDAAFLNALTVYQGTNKLPIGGLNEATLRHLGVIE